MNMQTILYILIFIMTICFYLFLLIIIKHFIIILEHLVYLVICSESGQRATGANTLVSQLPTHSITRGVVHNKDHSI